MNKITDREKLLRYTSNVSQIAGITKLEAVEGRGKGTAMYRVKTGSGLEFTSIADKCLDLGEVSFKGININFMNKNGLVSNQWFNNFEDEFGHYFSGGMLVTCGLQNTGGANRDEDGTYYGTHGRIGMTPAENAYSRCSWQGNDYVMELGGTMRESALFGINLVFDRKITTAYGSNEIHIHDTLYNDSDEMAQYLILYHFNFGFPFLSPELQIKLPKGEVTPRTPEAKAGLADYLKMTEPEDGFFEHVFFHDPETDENGYCTVKLENPELKIGAYIKFDKKYLPVLTEWKSMKSVDYALGIEPGNSRLGGRTVEKKNGTISDIEPFGKREFDVTLGFYEL